MGSARRLTSVSTISNSSASATSGTSSITMASEAVTWGERMGGSCEAGPTEALNSISCCGGVEATEGPDLLERSSISAVMMT